MYGYPPTWPAAFRPDADELEELLRLCRRVSARFTEEWNRAALELRPDALPSSDAFAEHGPLVLYNYPEELADDERRPLLPPHRFLGSTRRDEPEDPEVEAWLATAGPFVYVSFGSFLSVRGDVLRRVADALRALDVARGDRDRIDGCRASSASCPSSWLVRDYLPQVRLLGAAAAAVTHGGNNSVTEAIGSGVPLVVLPFSTDQFAGAAAVERSGFGVALDPNAASVDELASRDRAGARARSRCEGAVGRRGGAVRPRRQDRNWRSPRSRPEPRRRARPSPRRRRRHPGSAA